ncbi:hypothetical protein AZH11_27145 [Pseudomonas simiae]|nr:hypothetical protein AZH11_27145 [Pseudomonas simiae]
MLYLAQANNRLAPNGALIQGQDVSLITGGDLHNSGTLRATNNLSMVAGNIDNSGLMQAGNRLEMLATDSIRNTRGGIINARDISATAVTGDILNERTVTTFKQQGEGYQLRNDVASDASRFEATDTLKLNAGRDVLNVGSDLKAGGNASVTAGRDVVIASQTEQDDYAYQRRRVKGTEQTTLQYGSNVDVGGNLAIDARRDIAVVASTVSAAKDLSVKAGENLTLAAAANEQHDYSKGKKGGTKTTTQLDTVTQQSAELKAGGDLIAVAGTDLTLVASKISAGNEAYVHADNELQLLAAQDSNYSLYDMSKKGGWGSKKTQRDEVTQVTNVGSEIKTGGDLTLQSGGDQKYQAAKLDSGRDIAIVSGGAVTFEAVKDLHDESHTKSKGDLAWTSSKGKGNTDETLRQTQMIAEGNVVIKAVDGLKIDIKQIDQNTVSQTIDAMVKADPQLAWLKEAEKRGDVDWRQVKELHESFKYSNSGLGAGAQIIIAIIVTYFTMGAASGAIAAAGTGTSMAGATAAATATSAAGWANAAGSVVLGGMASNGAISTINNRGNLGAVLKDVTSSDAMRGYVVSGVTAGLTAGVYDKWTSTQTGTSTALPNTGAVATVSPLSTWQGVGQFTANQVLQNGTSVLVDRALGGEARLGEALQNSLANAFAAYGFNLVGDVSKGRFAEGGITKIGLHALMGGLAAEASGGDFRTGALAAGVTEALVDSLAKNYAAMPDDQKKGLLVMNSQLIGVLAASVLDGADAKSLQTGAWVAGNATQYNWLLHGEIEAADKARKGCDAAGGDVAGCKNRITSAMDSLDKARDMERAEQKRQVQLAAYQEGMTFEEYSQAIDSYWNKVDRNQVVHTGYGPAKEWGYIASGMGAGFADAAVNWPGKIYDTVTHLTDIPGNLLQAGKDGVDWINSPIPAQSLDRAGDQLVYATPEKMGGIIFDAATGAITAGVGGKTVEWIGGRWVARGAKGLGKDYVDILSPEAKQHILYGDKPGSGGHMWPGQEGKTVFPESWSGDKIVDAVGDITTSPSTKWYAQTGTGGAYTAKGDAAKWVAYETRDGVRMRVVYQPATGKVVTAFPDDAPIPPYKPIK